MSDERAKPPSAGVEAEDLSEEELAELERGEGVRALLQRSLASAEVDEPDAALLAGVQRRLRKRSRGKFYGDGWSTAHPRISYAVVAALMLLTIVAVWLVLGPTALPR